MTVRLRDAGVSQKDLGIQLPDPTEVRRNVYEFFNAYRICTRLLSRHFVEHPKIKATKGYKYAMDPDDVRVQRTVGGAPKGFSEPTGDTDLMTDKELEWFRFVVRIDDRVNSLKAPHRDLIRYRFLDNDPTPSDHETYMHWYYEQGWTHSFRTFERIKREAVHIIAAGLDADC